MWARQHAWVGICEGVDQAIERPRRIAATDSTDSAAGLTPITASPQPNSRPSSRREQDAAEVVGRVVRLDPDAEDARGRPSCSGIG